MSVREPRAKAGRDLAEVEKRIAGILAAIQDGMYHSLMKAKMEELEDRKRHLEACVAEEPEPAILRMHPSLTTLYRQKIGDLASALSDPAVRVQAAGAMRGLISEIRMRRTERPPDRLARRPGWHSGIGGGGNDKALARARASSIVLVAGVGFEPTTFRL